jgi:hypothetical protein
LLNALSEQVEVCSVPLDLNNWQVDKHTCNLGSILLTGESGDKLEDCASDDLLVAWVDLGDCCVDW